MTLITFALCEKEGRVGVTDLEIVDVLTDGVTDLDGDFLAIFDDLLQEETEEALVNASVVEEEPISLDLIFSFHACLNGSSSK